MNVSGERLKSGAVSSSSIYSLFRFLLWYGIAVAALFQLLPMAASFVQDQYEAMAGSARLLSVIGFFCVTGVWQIIGMKNRMESP